MKITCLGDSFTEGVLVRENYTTYLASFGHEVINLGINGDTTSGMLNRYKADKTDVLIIFGGSNDFYQGERVDKVLANVGLILEKSEADKNIIIIPPYIEEDEFYPSYSLVNNAVDDYGVRVKDLPAVVIDARDINPSYIDGLHMREDFHKKLANKIKEVL